MTSQPSLTIDTNSRSETTIKYMLALAWPMIIQNMSFTIMQFIDTWMVSKLGTDELAAILPAGFISFVPASFLLGVINIVNTFVSQSLGRRQYKDCSSYCWQVIYMGLLYSAVMLIAIWPLAAPIFRLMNQPEQIIPLEVVYLRMMLICHFPIVFIWASSQFFMGVHRPRLTMYAAVIGQIINVIANYVLIFGKFGAPALGIVGAGFGTLIGVLVGALIRMIFLLTGEINHKYQCRKTLAIDFGKMMSIVRFGLPAGFALMTNIAIWCVILFALVGIFGTESLAATTSVWSCMRVSFMPVLGVGSALTAAVGRSIGKGRRDLAIKQTHTCLRMAFVYMCIVGLCLFIFRHQIMHFWAGNDPKVVAIGVNLLICAAVFQLFDAFFIICGDALRGAGDTVWLAMVELFCAIVVLGGGGYLAVTYFPELGALGPWIAGTGKIIFGAAANFLRFKSGRWEKIDIFRKRKITLPVSNIPSVETEQSQQ